MTGLTKKQRISFEKAIALGLFKMLYNQELLSKEEYENCLAETEKEFVLHES